MGLTLHSFLQFLKNLVSFITKRWSQSTRRLLYIFALLRSRYSPRYPKRNEGPRQHTEPQPAKPRSTTVICASRLPHPPLTPIAGGDTPIITSPAPISISVRQPTILNPVDTINEPYENDSAGHLGVDNYFLEASRPLSGSRDSANYHQEPEHIHPVLPPNPEEFTSNSPISRSSSQHSHRPGSYYHYPGHYQGNRPWSQYSFGPPSERSFHPHSSANGAEAAARGYLPAALPTRPPSPSLSVRPPSIAGSVASHVYHASRPSGRVRRPSPMSNAPRRRHGSQTPSVRQSVHEPTPDVPVIELPQPESQTTGSVRHGRNSAAVSFDQPWGVLRPMLQIDRYDKHAKFLRESLPEDWEPLMHPEGALYWIHKKEPIYTDTNMCNPDLQQRIDMALKEINKLRKNLPPLPMGDWELALELGEDGETGEPICSYYFIHHTTRCLFWLHEFDLEHALGGLRGVTELPHIHLTLQSQYWTHWEMYPHNREIYQDLLQELLGILVHAGVDCMTSPNSTAPYSEGELQKLLGYVRHVEFVGGNYGFSACIVGRLMSFFVYTRYLNFYGQRGARLTNDQTIYGTQPKRTPLIKTLSIFFFYAPELHLRGLETVYTDSVLCQHRWAQFITRLQNDWTEFILYGTVLLNANVAFLAVPSVDPGTRNRTPSQLASYLSIITSIGSIVVGLLLLRQHRTKPNESSEEVDNYLRSRRGGALGFETLAILYSLPYSLLLWSTMSFAAAFCFETLVLSHQLWVKLSVGVALGLIILLIFWCIWTSIEAGAEFSVLGTILDLKGRFVNFTRGLRGSAPKPVPGAGELESENGRGENGRPSLSGTLKEAFSRFRRNRGISTSSTLVGHNPAGSKMVSRPSGCTEVEMREMGNEEPRYEV